MKKKACTLFQNMQNENCSELKFTKFFKSKYTECRLKKN